MNLKKIRANRAAARRHRQLLRAADDVVSRSCLHAQTGHASPVEVIAIAFGRYQLRIGEADLNAVLAERGFSLRNTGTSTAETES
jgi:hypothetical protein